MKNRQRQLLKGLLLSILLPGICLGAVKKENEEDSNRFPLGCKPVGSRFELRTLHILPKEVGEQQSLYFFHNESNKPVKLYQMRAVDNPGNLYLNHVISGSHWGALATSEPDLRYACAIDDGKTPGGLLVDCASVLRVCEFARVKFGLNNRGNFWFVSNGARNSAVRDVTAYGIIPR